MEQSNLIKLVLIISIIGTFSILLISEYSSLEITSIKDLTSLKTDSKVKIQAKILSIKETPGLYILKLQDSSSTTTGVIFKEDPLDLKVKDQVEIIGKTTKYQNQVEVIIDQITLLS